MTPSTDKASAHTVLVEVVESKRKAARLSLRTAADIAGMSEATWRQLVAGGVNAGGKWVERHPRRDQVLDMARAVGALDVAADALDATPDEVEAAERRVIVTDPAEQEIMSMRHLRPVEKLALIQELEKLRGEYN
jgi:transcriptional regulator with XRE-family HTH domain